MTKVQIRFDLARPLDEALLLRVAAAHGIYGLLRVQPAPSLDALTVDYDASRLKLPDVKAILRRAGISVRKGPYRPSRFSQPSWNSGMTFSGR